MEGEEHLNEVPSVGGSGSEAEISSFKNLERNDSLDEEKKLEDLKSCQTEECAKKDLEVSLELTETVVISEEEVRGEVHAKNGSLSLKDESPNGSVEIERRGILL